MDSIYPIIIAIIFHLIDLLSGLIGAVKTESVQSSKMRDGLFKKIGFIFCYVLAFLIDMYGTKIGLNLGVDVLPIIVLYAVITEIVSIIENISVINPDLLPEKLMKLFHITSESEEIK